MKLTIKEAKWIDEHVHCPDAIGFEGPETFSDCGECIICKIKGKVRAYELSKRNR